MIVPITLLFAFFGSTFGYEGLALGGYGATNFIELIEGGKICGGDDVTPSLPSVIPAANPTWVAEFVDNAIYLCGGQVKIYSPFYKGLYIELTPMFQLASINNNLIFSMYTELGTTT